MALNLQASPHPSMLWPAQHLYRHARLRRCRAGRFMRTSRDIYSAKLSCPIEFISIYGILGLRRKEAPAMGSLRFTHIQARPTEVLDLTSLTPDEFRRLVPPFEA